MTSVRPDWPHGTSAMAARLRDHDWATTSLGPVADWPPALRVLVETIGGAAQPMLIAWGPRLATICNDGWLARFGDGAVPLPGRPLGDWPEPWPRIAAAAASVFAGETVTCDLASAGGALSLSPVWHGQGVGGVLVVPGAPAPARDAAEIRLRESEARHRLLVGSWAQAVWETDPDGVVVTDSTSWRAYTGQSVAQWLGYGWLDAIHPDDRAYAERQWREAVAAHDLVDAEFRLRAPQGGWRWTNVRAAPVTDAAGRIVKWVGMNIDVDARKRAVALLRETSERQRVHLETQIRDRAAERQASHDLLQAMMDASTDMIQVFEAVRDQTGEIVDFIWVLNNHTSQSRYGEVRGESLLQRNPGVLVEGIFDTFRRVTETGVPDHAERHYVHEQFDGWFQQSVVRLGDGVATTTRDISAWKAAQAELLRLQDEIAQNRLRASEERFRLLVESVRDYAIFTTDTDGCVTSWPAGAASVFGWTAQDILGKSVDLTYVPEDVASGQPQRERDLARRDGAAPNVRWHRRGDGSRIFIDGSTQRLTGADGEVREFIKIGQDVTEARRVQQALTQSEDRLRTLTEGIPQLVWRSADAGRWTWSSPQWQAFTGQSLPASTGTGWLAAVHPADRDAVMAAWGRASETGAVEAELRVRRDADGAYLWHRTRALPVRDADGRIVEWLGTSTDIDDLRRLQQRQQLLVAELQHRVRNILTIVRSVFQRTIEADVPHSDMIDHFRGRLDNLARTQVIVTQSASGEVDLRNLITEELLSVGAHEGQGVILDGPDVALDSRTAESIGLAIHELTTNAVKYGALRTQGALLTVRWSTDTADGGAQRLDLTWKEQGVPAVSLTPARHGFGSELITEALPYRLGAETMLEFRGGGIRCTISMPLPEAAAPVERWEDR